MIMRGWRPAALFAATLAVLPPRAQAHDWYTGQMNVFGSSCCYGEGAAKDCDPVPFASVREVAGGFIVTLTKEQMLAIRPGLARERAFRRLAWGISEFVPAREALPALDGGYSACLRQYPVQVGGIGPLRWIICFFYPTNS